MVYFATVPIEKIEETFDVGVKINKPNGWYQCTQEELSKFSQGGSSKVTQTKEGKALYDGTGLLKVLSFFRNIHSALLSRLIHQLW